MYHMGSSCHSCLLLEPSAHKHFPFIGEPEQFKQFYSMSQTSKVFHCAVMEPFVAIWYLLACAEQELGLQPKRHLRYTSPIVTGRDQAIELSDT